MDRGQPQPTQRADLVGWVWIADWVSQSKRYSVLAGSVCKIRHILSESPEQLLLFPDRLGSNLQLQQALNAGAKDEI
jgi:hypothetical protein